MRALVTGSVGFIGCHLCSRLVSDGWEVLGVDIRAGSTDRAGVDSSLSERRAHSQVRNIVGDIMDMNLMHSLAGEYRPDVIFHLAAVSSVHAAEQEPQHCYDTNIGGTENVLRAARHTGARVIFASSSAIYGHSLALPKPIGVYGRSKYEAELICAKSGITDWTLRPFTVLGRFGREDMAAWIFASQISSRRTVTLRRGAIRDMVDVRDVARAFAMAGSSMRDAPMKVADVGTGVGTHMEEFAKMIANELNRPLQVEQSVLPPFEAMSTQADLAMAKHLNWTPQIPLSESIKDFVEWYKSTKSSQQE